MAGPKASLLIGQTAAKVDDHRGGRSPYPLTVPIDFVVMAIASLPFDRLLDVIGRFQHQVERRFEDPRDLGCMGHKRQIGRNHRDHRSEEHTSELQSLMRISYAVFCLKKKKPQL